MVVLEREIPAEADQVFAIVVDPHTYPHWLTGTKKISDVDDGYPAPGLRFRHEVGLGPVTVQDSTRVDALGERHLELTVYARPLLVGRVRFDVGADGGDRGRDLSMVPVGDRPAGSRSQHPLAGSTRALRE